jgi:hypothetical protein
LFDELEAVVFEFKFKTRSLAGFWLTSSASVTWSLLSASTNNTCLLAKPIGKKGRTALVKSSLDVVEKKLIFNFREFFKF